MNYNSNVVKKCQVVTANVILQLNWHCVIDPSEIHSAFALFFILSARSEKNDQPLVMNQKLYGAGPKLPEDNIRLDAAKPSAQWYRTI